MTNKNPLSLIAAVSKNFVLGNEGDIPWHLSKDFAYFKKMTLNKPIIMGRKTFESIGRPLPKRLNIVLTRDENFKADGVTVFHTKEAALEQANTFYSNATDTDQYIMIIGGEQIYRLFLDQADTVYLTQVELEVDGDAHFPKLDTSWQLTQSIAEEEKGIHFYFNTYQRIK